MKRFLTVVVILFISALAFAQAQIDTKREKLSDFPEKVTKVVLSGKGFLNAELQQAVKDCWLLSPYEFCDLSEFNSLKASSDYYFLIPILTQYRKEEEPGVMMLSLLKGGKGAEKGLDGMLEVVSVPLCSVEDPSGRELVFMPAFIDIIQAYVTDAMSNGIKAMAGLKTYSSNLGAGDDLHIVFSEADIAFDISDSKQGQLNRKNILIMSEDDADQMVANGVDNVMVSYSVYPSQAAVGSYCYNMMVGAGTHKLYYYRKYKITKKSGPGFLKKDISKIAR